MFCVETAFGFLDLPSLRRIESACLTVGTKVECLIEESTMGDKGKKDKEKSRKQKIDKQTQMVKKVLERVPVRLPPHKS
jgi:hypothetical protein